MNDNILNYGIYFKLDNGNTGRVEINEKTKEGLELGFMDVYECVEISLFIAEDDIPEDRTIDNWEIKPLDPEDIVYLNEEDRPE